MLNVMVVVVAVAIVAMLYILLHWLLGVGFWWSLVGAVGIPPLAIFLLLLWSLRDYKM